MGTVSAGLLADDPFGWREGLGGILILSAGLVETFLARSTEGAESDFEGENYPWRESNYGKYL